MKVAHAAMMLYGVPVLVGMVVHQMMPVIGYPHLAKSVSGIATILTTFAACVTIGLIGALSNKEDK